MTPHENDANGANELAGRLPTDLELAIELTISDFDRRSCGCRWDRCGSVGKAKNQSTTLRAAHRLGPKSSISDIEFPPALAVSVVAHPDLEIPVTCASASADLAELSHALVDIKVQGGGHSDRFAEVRTDTHAPRIRHGASRPVELVIQS